MAKIKLLSWHEDVQVKANLLKSKGATIDASPLVRTSAVVGELARLNPAALVLDLDRLPPNSREIALMLRTSKSARHIPVLFAGALASDSGLPQKYVRLKSELPDIPYAVWQDAPTALKKLLSEPKTEPNIAPPARVYTASLAQKLGVVSGSSKTALKTRHIALMAAPEDFVDLLGDLPETVTFTSLLGATVHLAMCFVRSGDELAGVLNLLRLRLPATASAWICYPKRTSSKHRDFNENDVRKNSLAAGFVDYKICSIDAEWSAMKFAWRKAK